jgi:predicted GNAT superfamily acetyltransferase
MMKIRIMQPADFSAVVELNLRSVHYLSSLSLKRLAQLHARAAYARVMEADGRIVAFVLAFRENAGYDSPNYLWFSDRYNAFLYIDRVVVRENHRRKGIAGIFYQDLFSYAAQNGVAVITCEVDILPPNPISLQFHRNRGFTEVGTLRPYDGPKQVALMEKRLSGEK